MSRAGWFCGGIAAVLLLLTACSSLPLNTQSPRVTLIGLGLVSMDLLEQRYQVRLRVKNPNSFDLPVRGMDFQLEINGREFADGVSNQRVDVPAYGESVIALEVSSGLLQVFRQLQSLESGGAEGVSYRISGKVAVGEAGRRMPFEYAGEFQLPDSQISPAPEKI